jgi:chromosomal replication initiation ATPase DnaA
MTLPFATSARHVAQDFIAAPSNAAARRWLASIQDWPGGRLVLSAGAGYGKTHLARNWARSTGLVLDGGTLTSQPRGHDYPRLVVDDADDCRDEPALLHLLNIAAESGRAVLLTGRSPPSRWPLFLADLSSRVRAVQVATIDPPEDDLLRALLARMLAERQLAVPQAVQDWLLLRLPRNPRALSDAATLLDAASMASKQPVTRALARACLSSLLDDEDCVTDTNSSRHPALPL